MSYTLTQSRPVQKSIAAYAGSIADSFASTPAVGSLIVVTGGGGSQAATYTVSDNQGNTYTVAQTNASESYSSFIAYALAATSSGTFTVTVSQGGQKDNLMQISEWAGNAASSVMEYTTIGSLVLDNTVVVATSGSTAAAGDLVVSTFVCEDESLTLTTYPSGFNALLYAENTGSGAWTTAAQAAAYKIAGAAGVETATWPDHTSSGSNGQYGLLVAFKAAAGTASDPAASSSRFTTSRHTFGTRR